MKQYLKKAFFFFAMCAYGVGAIGGLGWTLYNKAWLIAVCVAALAAMAFPTVKTFYKKLME